jgi:hypothetical protein
MVFGVLQVVEVFGTLSYSKFCFLQYEVEAVIVFV